MRIDAIKLVNYGSFYGEHEFSLADRGLCIVLGDNRDEPRMNSNGSGKSTLFDALDWCLWGVVPRGDHVDSVVSEVGGKGCEVCVRLVDDDDVTPIVVRRFRGLEGEGNGCELWVGDENRSALDAKETQRHIERALGMDRDVFHAAVLMAQTDILRFADAKDSDRMSILTKILDLGQVDEWLDRAKMARKRVGVRQEELQRELNQRQGQVQMAEAQIPDLQAKADRLKDERATKLRETTVALNRHLENIPKYEAILAREPQVRAARTTAEQALAALQAFHVQTQIPDLPPLDTRQYQEEIQRARAVEVEWARQRDGLTSQGRAAAQRIEKFSTMAQGQCSECGQEITGEHLQREVARLTAERDQLRDSWAAVDAEYQQAQRGVMDAEGRLSYAQGEHERARQAVQEQNRAHMDAERAHAAEVRTAERAIAELDKDLSNLAAERESLTKTCEYVDYLRGVMEETRTKENPYDAQLQELSSLVTGVREQMKAFEQELEKEAERCLYYDFWVEAFGPKGLKSYILDSRLQEMSDAANHWVKVLTGGTIWVRFETQTKGRSTGKLSNKINIRVFRWEPTGQISERNYCSWSGGEKQRVSLGIDFGLSRLIARRASKRYDVLILDELFRHLDRGGREAVVEMLQHIRQEKGSVFVVDHDAEFQGAFENRVLVRKENRCSNIVELGNGVAQQEGTESGDDLGAEAVIPEGAIQQAFV